MNQSASSRTLRTARKHDARQAELNYTTMKTFFGAVQDELRKRLAGFFNLESPGSLRLAESIKVDFNKSQAAPHVQLSLTEQARKSAAELLAALETHLIGAVNHVIKQLGLQGKVLFDLQTGIVKPA